MRIDPRDFVERMTLPVWQAAAATRWLEGRVDNRPKLDEDTDEKSALTDADCISQEILLTALREFFPDEAHRSRASSRRRALLPTRGQPGSQHRKPP